MRKTGSRTHKSWPWHVPETDAAAAERLCAALGIHRLTVVSLLRLGMSEPADARRFFECNGEDQADPRKLLGADLAARRLVQAKERRETILVCSDYDADGVTATAKTGSQC